MDTYENDYWCKLSEAVNELLLAQHGHFMTVSFEQVYSCVYKCVCNSWAKRLYLDLRKHISSHLETVASNLTMPTSDPVGYIKKFDEELQRYIYFVQVLVPVFSYLNRFYVISVLKSDLTKDLLCLFAEIVADRHVATLIPLMDSFSRKPFTISPSTMQHLTQNLAQIRKEYIEMRPHLFSLYLVNVLPACSLSDLEHARLEVLNTQRDLCTHPNFVRGDQSRKRACLDDTYEQLSNVRNQPFENSHKL